MHASEVTEITLLTAIKRLSLSREKALKVVTKLSKQTLPEKIRHVLLKTQEALTI